MCEFFVLYPAETMFPGGSTPANPAVERYYQQNKGDYIWA
jgi:hypothetical protein